MPIEIKSHSVILFQGDSITDVGRSRHVIGPNNPDGLGNGYPQLVSDYLFESYPEHYLQIYNRGISGDRIRDLARRWKNDSLRLLPNIISVLIGVNDTWNYLYMGMGSDPTDYQEVYQKILQNTQQQLPDVQFILCEPFVLITGEVTNEWMDDVVQRQEITRNLALDFGGIFVPFQTALNEKEKNIPAKTLLEDGVHPTDFGHRVLAECWMEAVLG